MTPSLTLYKSTHRLRVASAVVLFAAFSASAARADIAPADVCSQVGRACNTAGAQYNQPGTCAPSTCSHSFPSSDGTFSTTTYACNKCIASSASVATDSAAPSSSVTTDATAVPPVQPAEKKGGCDVGDSAPIFGEFAWMIAAALAIVPRRKRRSRIVDE